MRAQTKLLIATTNMGKVKELSEYLSNCAPPLCSLSDYDIQEAEETGTTFEENAIIKARHYSLLTGLWTLADDSGLEVQALGGAPGVYSARYGGKDASYPERISKLLRELDMTGDTTRNARFVCVLALALPGDARTHTFEGECKGRIARSPRGFGGFGYDPIFIPDGDSQTFGEMTSVGKQRFSHRARAAAQLKQYLRENFHDQP